jgi:hypothetical protein
MPARQAAAEVPRLERRLSGLENQAYGLTPGGGADVGDRPNPHAAYPIQLNRKADRPGIM